MSENYSLFLPESQRNILNIVCALAWADNELSGEEKSILLEGFKSNLPPEPEIIGFDEIDPLFGEISFSSFSLAEQTQARINAEKAFTEIVKNYQENPIPLKELVSKLETIEDRCLTLKLGFMVIKASPDKDGNLIGFEEKAIYRELIELLNLDDDTIQTIENRASRELNKFQNPLKAFMENMKTFFLKKI